mmetsp:Transcript_74039/g.228836  ORF Transcript_74039/g.228836 Transcript_74039/m.228836 type:complete len:204 (+) Transcript_74039:314-925(+)
MCLREVLDGLCLGEFLVPDPVARAPGQVADVAALGRLALALAALLAGERHALAARGGRAIFKPRRRCARSMSVRVAALLPALPPAVPSALPPALPPALSPTLPPFGLLPFAPLLFAGLLCAVSNFWLLLFMLRLSVVPFLALLLHTLLPPLRLGALQLSRSVELAFHGHRIDRTVKLAALLAGRLGIFLVRNLCMCHPVRIAA